MKKYVVTQIYKKIVDCERQILVKAENEDEALLVHYDSDANAFIIKDDEFDCQSIDVENVEIEEYKEDKHGKYV